MDLEKLVVTIIADGSKYTGVLNGMLAQAEKVASGIRNAFMKAQTALGIGNLLRQKDLDRFQTLGTVAKTAANVLTGVLGYGISAVTNILGGVFSGAVSAATSGLMAMVSVAGTAGEMAITLANEYEQAAVAFEVMTGSAEKGKEVLESIARLATTTPFTSRELVNVGQQLIAYGVDVDALLPTLSRLGDVAAGGAGETLDVRLQRIAYAFGEVRNNQRLFAAELRQFQAAGVPLSDYLAKVMETSTTNVKAMVEAGRVGYPEVVQAFNMMTSAGGRFFQLSQRMSTTVPGQWSNLKDNVQILLRNVGLSFFRGFGLGDLLGEFSQIVQGVQQKTDQLDSIFGNLRKIFDVFRAAVQGVGKTLFEALTGVGEGLDWGAVEEVALNTFETIIRGIGKILQGLKQVAVFIVDNVLVPMAKAADDLGLVKNDKPSGFYSRARAEGNNKLASGFAWLGGEAIDLVLPLREHLERKGEITPGQGASAIKRLSEGMKGMVSLEEWADKAAKEMRLYHDQLKSRNTKAKEEDGPLPFFQQLAMRARNLESAVIETQLAFAFTPEDFTDNTASGAMGLALGDSTAKYSMHLEKRIREMNEQTKGLDEYYAKQAQDAAKIPVPFDVGTDARATANKFIEEMRKGGDALGIFNKTMADINKAAYPHGPGGAAVGGAAFGAAAGVPGFAGEAADRARFQTFMDLRKAVQNRLETTLPPALLAGTQEAQDAVNRTNAHTFSWQDEVLRVMTAAKEAQVEEKQMMKEVVEQLKKLNGEDAPKYNVMDLF